LRDGSLVLIRPVHDADTALLGDLFSRLSPGSRQLRSLGVKNELGAADVRQLTDVDHHNHEAMWALSPEDGRAIGIVRYVRFTEVSDQAEVALTVVDAWQRRRVGTEMLAPVVSYARQEGISSFSAVTSEENVAILGMLQNLLPGSLGQSANPARGDSRSVCPMRGSACRPSGRPVLRC
jgi:RimJ/RimL family protein N-acetyltransferase